MNLRIWGELLFIVVVLVIIIGVVFSIMFASNSTPMQASLRRKKLKPAEWVAADYTVGNETVVIVELRRPLSNNPEDFNVLDKREVGRITNGLRDYDQLYYDNMQEANNRAAVLNALHR